MDLHNRFMERFARLQELRGANRDRIQQQESTTLINTAVDLSQEQQQCFEKINDFFEHFVANSRIKECLDVGTDKIVMPEPDSAMDFVKIVQAALQVHKLSECKCERLVSLEKVIETEKALLNRRFQQGVKNKAYAKYFRTILEHYKLLSESSTEGTAVEKTIEDSTSSSVNTILFEAGSDNVFSSSPYKFR